MDNTKILDALNQRFPGKDNNGRPKTAYFEKLLAMKSETLFRETKEKIWLSAYASNNPRSDYHWQVDACYMVYQLRGDEHAYKQAFRQVYISQFGRDPYPEEEAV